MSFKTILIVILFMPLGLYAQCVVENGSDYKITAEFYPVTMIPQNGCTSGPGNFKAEIEYKIKVEGPNIPTNPVNFYQIVLFCGNRRLQASGNLPVTTDSVSGTYLTAQNFFRNGDCATSTPQSLDCIGNENIRFRGRGPNNFRFNIRCDALERKVEFEELKGLFANAQYIIDWKIMPSRDIDYFIVEKSFDKVSFQSLSNKLTYQENQSSRFVDASSNLFAQQNFYRIKAVKSNGSSAYSEVFTGGQF